MPNPFIFPHAVDKIGDAYWIYATSLPHIYIRSELDYNDPEMLGRSVYTYTEVIGMTDKKICFLGTLEDEDGYFWATRAGTTKSIPFSDAEYALQWLDDQTICPFCPSIRVERISNDFFGSPAKIDGVRCCDHCHMIHLISSQTTTHQVPESEIEMATVEQIGKYYYVRLKDGSLLKSYTGKTRYFRKHYAATFVADSINRVEKQSAYSRQS